jgi:CheY-like chemotaxis protein
MLKRILCVDDEPNVLHAFERQFRKEFDIHTALGPEIALQKLAAEGPFAVVVSDMRMPVMNGAELLRALSKQPGTVQARVVISTDGSEARKAEVVGLNVDWYLEKPLRPEVMRDVLSKVAERVHG